jgi:hypothetical protein
LHTVIALATYSLPSAPATITAEEIIMTVHTTSFRRLGSLALVLLTLIGGILTKDARGVPAPKSTPYALLYIPKKTTDYDTTQYRRKQITLIRTNSAPFVLFWAIRGLKNTDLPSLPQGGKGGENRFDNEKDIAWLAQHLKLEYLDGTGVLRISLDAGKPREQALLVNAVVHGYFQVGVHPRRKRFEDELEVLQKSLKSTMAMSAALNGEKQKILERKTVEIEDNINL